MRQVDLGIPGPAISIRKAAVEWGSVIVGALVMALLVKAYLFQAFYIPSPSMEPTLGNGDRIIVNKLSYRLHQVNRGDVVVFEAPPGAVNGVEDLIKRVIALPGETISAEAGRLRIDGGLLLEPYLVAQDLTSGFTLPPGCLNPSGTADTCLVPPGHVFVLGDNRTNSKDGRFFGPIPEDSILGRAFLRVWPLGDIGRL
jgi:signal peptidase I